MHFWLGNVRPEKAVCRWRVLGHKPRFWVKKAITRILLDSQYPAEEAEMKYYSSKLKTSQKGTYCVQQQEGKSGKVFEEFQS